MTPITEQNNLGDLLKYEAPNRYSRDVATIAAGQNLPLYFQYWNDRAVCTW